MDIFSKLRLDTWYGIILYLGALAVLSGLYFDKDFLNERHLIGLGIGMISVGLAIFMSEKYAVSFKRRDFETGPAALMQQKIIKPGWIQYILLLLGIGMILFFGFHLIISLV